MDEVAESTEKDIQVSKDKIQSHSIHNQNQSFQMIFMPENKERVLPPFSFEFEEEYIVF